MKLFHRLFSRLPIALIVCWAGSSVVGPAYATPPTPPAQLKFPDAKKLQALKAQDGVFTIPLRVVSTPEVARLSVQVRVKLVDPLKPRELDKQRYPVRKRGKVEQIEIKLPIRKKAGTYRVEVELHGETNGKSGVLDRLILYQVVDKGGERLMTPSNFRRMQSQERKESFRRRLQEKPDQPDIRLLSPDTVKVPRTISKKITVYKGRRELGVRGVGPSPGFKPYIVDKTKENWDSQDPITVRGRITFLDFDGTWRPLVNVSVNLYDDDAFGDDHLGTTTTDWNGNWSFTVNNDDGFLQNGRDIYYTFHLGNTRWHVRDSGGDDYVWKSSVHNDLSEGAVVDYGTETGSTNPEAMQIFAVINLGWNHIVTVGGQDPGHVEIRFPESTTAFFPSSERVKIEMQFNDGPDVTLHEYGHALMHYAFGGTSISPGGSHGFGDDKQDKGLAYSEGWATGYMLSVCPDGWYNWHEGNTEAAGEWPTCSVQNDTGRKIELFSDSGNRVGEENEGRVAAVINDFRDSPNDNNGGTENRGRNGEQDTNSANRIFLATIYRDNMWGFVHNDFLEFWISFAGDLSGTARSQADDIMQYNWMSLPIEVSCAASKVTVAKRRDYANLLAGLRSFRDHGLKLLQSGRRMIQTYYSHSPELAMLVIRNQKTRDASLVIIEHFSRLGHAFASRERLQRLLDSETPVVPPKVRKAVATVMKVIEAKGSEELRRELVSLREVLDEFERASVGEAMHKASSMTKAEKGRVMTVINPHALAPGSRKVDWELIRKHLPESVE